MGQNSALKRKLHIFMVIIALAFLLISLHLAQVQLLQNGRYRMLARQNYMRMIPIQAPRGRIYDRTGVELVGSQAAFNIDLFYTDMQNKDKEIAYISSLLGISPSQIQDTIKKYKDAGQLYLPIPLVQDADQATVTKVEENKMNLPGVYVDAVPQRNYPYGGLLAQTLGYVQQITPQELAAHKDDGYQMNSLFGQTGLENEYESYLRGQDGAREIAVDSLGRPIHDQGVKPPVPGDNLQLTISKKLQQTAEQSLINAVQQARASGRTDSMGGAAVVEDVHTGQILAMASVPTFNPGDFARGLSPQEAQQIFNGPAHPFLNRALSAYAPGSTFKMVVAAAALEAKVITPDTLIDDPGYFQLGNHIFHNWASYGFGLINVVKALQVSNDTFFYKVGHMLGWQPIAHWAGEFGLGQKTGIDLPGETTGTLPTPQYKKNMVESFLKAMNNGRIKAIVDKYNQQINKTADKAQKDELANERDNEVARLIEQINASHSWDINWQEFDTINMSIGQGYNLYTPLQMADYVSTIANGGTLYRPYLVQKITSPDGQTVKTFTPQAVRRVPVSAQTLDVIHQGMSLVTQGTGTGAAVFAGFPIPVAGKTGTAEVAGHNNHAWFVCYAPADHPQVAVAVLVEHGWEGAVAAAPVAKDILSAYFNLDQTQGQNQNQPKH
ncbi:penicillin-binding protein 2 [Desulfotomaculum copahuensis]|uniref:Penicillin-binding protein 2 n=1 Tax=Desulfotomaculum copahuensis TaxID=1838280 RepID=A0A1B7LFC6_9FIRM|nr:penicillin-binding protein 2 [Desulfotomaculum copahuensis]OAT82292.1 penicillin-binding protein 2 [Desulfotomaculum copahuensis]